jgi:hypothetical protein
MKYTEQELAAKMEKRLAGERDRQRRWRLRQKEKGLKPIAGMISSEAISILNAQKKKTGETVSEILEKAILNLSAATMLPPAQETSPVPTFDDSPEPKNEPNEYKRDILNNIKKMRREDNLPFNEIARIFNEKGLKTLSGEEIWDGKSIYAIYKNIEER